MTESSKTPQTSGAAAEATPAPSAAVPEQSSGAAGDTATPAPSSAVAPDSQPLPRRPSRRKTPAAEAAPEAPEAATEAVEPEPEGDLEALPEPLRPRNFREALDQRYPHSAGYTLPQGSVWLTPDVAAAWDEQLARDCERYWEMHRETAREFDAEHAHVHTGTRLEIVPDVCVYTQAWKAAGERPEPRPGAWREDMTAALRPLPEVAR